MRPGRSPRSRASSPDVVVLDLELSDRSGLSIIGDLKRSSPRTRVVVFTAYAGEERVATAVSSGADSYVLKGASGDELVATVRAAAAGESRMAPEIARLLVGAMRLPRGMRLTEREREILALLAEGLPNRAIATGLNVTERTVKYHVGEILARLGASNRAQAVAIARRRGLLSPAPENVLTALSFRPGGELLRGTIRAVRRGRTLVPWQHRIGSSAATSRSSPAPRRAWDAPSRACWRNAASRS